MVARFRAVPFGTFNLPQIAPGKGCADLSTAAAYSLNRDGSAARAPGIPDRLATGEIQPNVSTLNSVDGRVKANAAIVPSGGNAVSVYASNTTDVVIDIDGYFVQANPSTLAFYTLPPCRVADTRQSSFPSGLGMPHLAGGVAA